MKMELGVTIDIQRSDGRVHSAIISGIDGLNVTVEWFEFGETKGKEINLEQVYSLNPSLNPALQQKSQLKQPSRRQSVPQNNPVNNIKDVPKKIASPAPRSRSATTTKSILHQPINKGLRSKSMIPSNGAKNTKNAAPPKPNSDVTMSHDDTVLHPKPIVENKEKENNKPNVEVVKSRWSAFKGNKEGWWKLVLKPANDVTLTAKPEKY